MGADRFTGVGPGTFQNGSQIDGTPYVPFIHVNAHQGINNVVRQSEGDRTVMVAQAKVEDGAGDPVAIAATLQQARDQARTRGRGVILTVHTIVLQILQSHAHPNVTPSASLACLLAATGPPWPGGQAAGDSGAPKGDRHPGGPPPARQQWEGQLETTRRSRHAAQTCIRSSDGERPAAPQPRNSW